MKNMQKYRRLKNLFLRQSYLDAWEDYMRSIRKTSYTQWDYNEYVLRIYGVCDNPKKTLEENGMFLNGTMKQLLENAKAGVQDIWENGEH